MTQSQPSSTAASSRSKKWWRWPLYIVLTLLLILTLAVAALLWWASSSNSLPQALRLAQKYLPEGQQLQFENAAGSITRGGTIEKLEWRMPGTAVAVQQFELDWNVKELLQRELNVQALRFGDIHVQITPQPDKPEEASQPFRMPENLHLPIKINLPLQVKRLEIETVATDGIASSQVIDDIGAHYVYDGNQHTAQLQSLHYQQSQLQAKLQLDASNLNIDGKLMAYLEGLVPEQEVRLLAPLQIQGSLAGGDAASITAHLQAQQLPSDFMAPAGASTMLADGFAAASTAQDAIKLDAQVTAHPWRTQPLQQAIVELNGFNAHDFHPQAPITAFSGSAKITPAEQDIAANRDLANTTWNLVLDLDNLKADSWDKQQLPLQKLTAQANLSNHAIKVEQANIQFTEGELSIQGQVNPAQPVDAQLQAVLTKLNLQKLLADLPETQFNGTLDLTPVNPESASSIEEASWNIQGDIQNTIPGLIDQQKVPLDRIQIKAGITPERWLAENLQLDIGSGSLQLQAEYAPTSQDLTVSGELRQLPLVQIHSQLAQEKAPALSGNLQANGNLLEKVIFNTDIASAQSAKAAGTRWDVRGLKAKGEWTPQQLTLEDLNLEAFQAKVTGQQIQVALPGLESVQATLAANAPGLSFKTNAAMKQQSGGGQLTLEIESAEKLLAWLKQLPVVGNSLPAAKAQGAVALTADWQGGWQQWLEGLQKPTAHPNLRVNAKLQSTQLNVSLPADKNSGSTEATNLIVKNLQANLDGNLQTAQLSLDADATANDTRLVLRTDIQAAQQAGQNNSSNTATWNINVNQLSAAATLAGQPNPWSVNLAPGLQINARMGNGTQISTSAGSASLTPPAQIASAEQAMTLNWEPVRFSQTATGATSLQSRGRIDGVQLTWIDALSTTGQPPLKSNGLFTDLLITGQWDIDMGDSLQVNASVQRASGDLWLGEAAIKTDADTPSGKESTTEIKATGNSRAQAIAAGIKTLNIALTSKGNALQANLDWETQRAGNLAASIQTNLIKTGQSWALPDNAPLSGQIKAAFPDLGVWTMLAPPGWRINGQLQADVAVAGTIPAPQLQGSITADGLNIRSVLDGVDLHDGRLRATLAGSRLNITELMLQGGTGSYAYVAGMSGNRTQPPVERGSMTTSGYIDWSNALAADKPANAGSGIVLDVKTQLQSMQVQVRNDRQMSLSGNLAASMNPQGTLGVSGSIMVDRASITLPESGAPTLGNDVVVVRASDAKKETPEPVGQLQTSSPMNLDITLNLGRDFALQGYGITSRLEGELNIRNRNSGNDPIAIVGEIRTDEGRYRAWGQALNVETGIVMFNGPYANPSLNLLAIRPNIDVRAGVRVTGTAQAPRVQLYSEPDLPDAEKLSWVVLGRSPASGGAEGNSMQQAALGFLAGSVGNSLASGLGFDEVGLSTEGVSIGKRLSDQLYVTYATGMSGAAGTLYVFYDITRRLTARGQTGEQSAIDLIYTVTYD